MPSIYIQEWPGGLIPRWDFEDKKQPIKPGFIVRLKAVASNTIILTQNSIERWEWALAMVIETKEKEGKLKITAIQWLNKEPKACDINAERFELCDESGINTYNVLMECPPIRTRLALGTVLAYNGLHGSEKDRGTQAVVIGQNRDNMVIVTWLNGFLRDGPQNLNIFYLPQDQSKAITFLPSEICQCQNCQSQRKITISITIEGSHFCDENCARGLGWYKCEDCGCHISEQRQEVHRTRGGERFVCKSCLDHYCECVQCHYRDIREHLFQHNDNLLCNQCFRRVNRLILDHSHRPTFIFNKMKWENTRYVGIELEIELEEDADKQRFAKKIKDWLKSKNLDKLVYLKEDGSLENGFEIVFHPFTLKSLHKTFPVKEFLQFLVDSGANSFDSGRCGHHVHVTKSTMTRMDLLKAKWFFVSAKEYIAKFSGRKNFSYCHFDEKIPLSHDPYNQPHGKYSALNVAASMETVEFRVFRGTLNYKKFMANLQFSEATIDFVQHIGGTFLRTKYPAEIWQAFIDYSKRTNQYKILTDFILQNRIV